MYVSMYVSMYVNMYISDFQTSLIWHGWRTALEYKDLTDLNREDKSDVVATNFQRNWDREVRRAGYEKLPSDLHDLACFLFPSFCISH